MMRVMVCGCDHGGGGGGGGYLDTGFSLSVRQVFGNKIHKISRKHPFLPS